MAADLHDQRPGPDPAACCRGRVKIVDCPVAGIIAVQGLLGRAVGALSHRFVELAVIQAGKGARLVACASR